MAVEKTDERLDWIILMKAGFAIRDEATPFTIVSVGECWVFDSCEDEWRLDEESDVTNQKWVIELPQRMRR